MSEIKPNDLLKPVKKVIKPYECSLIAVDGPRLVGRWHLEGLQIPYDSQFTSVMELRPGENALPIMYGHLGTNVTFIAIRVVYGSKLQVSASREVIPDKYIEYYYEDDTDTKRTFTDLLVLTGNDAHRIPQLYVYNPGEYIAELHILVANVKENMISSKLVPTLNKFNGLYYSSVLSDQINFSPSSTGSTQIEIYNDQNDLIISLPYSSISNIGVDCETLTIDTSNDENIILEFVSEFHAQQAHSRIMWVTEDSMNRYLTSDYPSIDNEAPVITFYSSPISVFSGTTVTKTELQEYFIKEINDNRDGEISIYDTEVTIKKQGSIRIFEQIEDFGNYDVTFTISDIANNQTTETKVVSMYSSPPVITYLPTSINNTMYINDPFYYKDTYNQNIIDENDIRNYYIDCVEDYVDDIAKSAVTVSIQQLSGSSSGLTDSGITLVGDYEITFNICNSASLCFTDTKNLKVYTNTYILPELLFNLPYTGNTFVILPTYNELTLIDETISGITNTDYDTTVSLDNVEIDGMSPSDYNTEGTYTVQYKVQNYSGFYNNILYTKNIIVDDSYAEINFNTYTGSTTVSGTSVLTDIYLTDYLVSSVTDTIDGIIDVSAVTLNIISGATTGITGITEDGLYELEFSVTNSRPNTTIESKDLIVDYLDYPSSGFTIYPGTSFP